MYQEYLKTNNDLPENFARERVVNAEFTLKAIDEAIRNHRHAGKENPSDEKFDGSGLIDQSVTLDFAAHGGTIYVKTT
jgi:hypothetical protein